MQKLIILITLLCSSAFAQDLACTYVNHDNTKGTVEIKVHNTNIVLEFKSLTVSAKNCKVQATPSDITVECDESGNSIGVIFELINGKFEGILMSEKASIFAQAKC